MPLVPTLLLADNDANACDAFRDALLEGTGPCELRTVASGGALEEHLAGRSGLPARQPALVVVDADLPPVGGADAVARIKGDPALQRTPVVVLARRPGPGMVAAAYDAGAATVLVKPVTFIACIRLVQILTAYWLDAAVLPDPPS